ncbi:MAG TPA: nitroreductase family protein [Thermomicrobiales bacterium]|jgi:nitroreductase
MSESSSTRDKIRLLRGLRAVREYLPDPVPEAVLDDIYEVARWTGSARNLQPWELVVVRERATLDRLSQFEGYAAHLAGAPLGVVLVMDGANEEYATYDGGRLAERIMLAAAAHGLGSCIGWWSKLGQDEVKRVLGIPADRIVRTVLAIGYPDEAARRALPKPSGFRKPIAEFVHQERFA